MSLPTQQQQQPHQPDSVASSTFSSAQDTPPSGSSLSHLNPQLTQVSPPSYEQHSYNKYGSENTGTRSNGNTRNSSVGRLTLQTDFDMLRDSTDERLTTGETLDDDDDDDDDGYRLDADVEAEEDEEEDGKGNNNNININDNRHFLPLSASSSSFPRYTVEEERMVVRKFDRKLVPFLGLLYLLSFLDRSNIGNAKIAGLTEDLNLSSSQYEWLLTAFYITYILFEWMTLMYRLVPPHIYISLCVCGWGLAASFQSLATSFWALIFLRAMLGITEAAFGPGVPFYLSLFYKREELAFRNGLFISAAPLATSFASSLAWLIVKLSSDGPIAPWRSLFLIEGFPSVIVAVFAWMVIPDLPGSARFLSRRLRIVAESRLSASKGDIHERRSFNWREVGKTLLDPKSYLTAFMFFSCNVAFSSMPVFLPTIINDMGFSPVTSQALCAPPYLFSFAVVLVTAYLSDRHRSRSPFLILHAILSSSAYLASAATGYFHTHLPTALHTSIRYLCLYPAVSGFFSAITLIITWTMDNRDAKEGKGTSIVIMNLVGQCGPLLGTRLYPSTDGPWYVRGMFTCSVFMVLVAILAFGLRVFLRRANLNSNSMAGNMEEVELGMYGESEGLMGGGGGGGGGLNTLYGHEKTRFSYIL